MFHCSNLVLFIWRRSKKINWFGPKILLMGISWLVAQGREDGGGRNYGNMKAP